MCIITDAKSSFALRASRTGKENMSTRLKPQVNCKAAQLTFSTRIILGSESNQAIFPRPSISHTLLDVQDAEIPATVLVAVKRRAWRPLGNIALFCCIQERDSRCCPYRNLTIIARRTGAESVADMLSGNLATTVCANLFIILYAH
jgi:hypothetical protein